MGLVHYNDYTGDFYSCVGGYIRRWSDKGEILEGFNNNSTLTVSTLYECLLQVTNTGLLLEDGYPLSKISNVLKADKHFVLTCSGKLYKGNNCFLENVMDFKLVNYSKVLVQFTTNTVALFWDQGSIDKIYSGRYINEVDLHEGKIYERGKGYSCYHNGVFGYDSGTIKYGDKVFELFDKPVLDLVRGDKTILATDGEQLKWFYL